MDLLFLIVSVALLATIVAFVRGIVSMTRVGAADREASTWLMLQRVEFQAAAVVLILAGTFLGID